MRPISHSPSDSTQVPWSGAYPRGARPYPPEDPPRHCREACHRIHTFTTLTSDDGWIWPASLRPNVRGAATPKRDCRTIDRGRHGNRERFDCPERATSGGILLILRADPENSKEFFKWGDGRSRVSDPATKAMSTRVPPPSRIHGRILSMTLPIQPGNA